MTISNEELGKAIRAAVFSTTIAKTKTFEIAMQDMPLNVILALLAYGTQRKFNDAVGGAGKDAKTKVDEAAAMIEEYKKGVVSKRRESTGGVDELTKVMRTLILKALAKAPDAAVKAAYKTHVTDGNAESRNKFADAALEKLPEDKKKLVEKAAKEQIKRDQERKAAIDGLMIDF